jgi:hypothetical protein
VATPTNSAEYHKIVNIIRGHSTGTTLQDIVNAKTLQQLHKIAGR